ncbi:MAG: zinc ribbon domain-containing protein [Nitrososphaeria archaeon]|nr:zinc ribbon domain-containing protein [Nitrososphaeria archaeon]
MMQNPKIKKLLTPLIISLIILLILLNSPTFALYNIISPQVTFTTLPPITTLPTITFLPFYSLYVNPTNVTLEQGQQVTVTVTVGSYFGYNKTVSLYTSNVPAGITISFALSKLTPPVNSNISTTAFVSVAKTVAAGQYIMFINATDGTIKKGVKFTVKVIQVSTTSTTSPSTTTSPTTTSPTTTTPTTTPSSTTTTIPTTTPTTTQPSPTTTSPPTSTSTPTTTSTQPSGGMDTTTIIIIAVVLIAVFAALAFFLLRKKPPPPPPPAKRYCMHCGSAMPEDAVSCPKCGKQPAGGPDTKVCPNCGSVINIVASFCPKCGAAQPKVDEKSGSASS